MSDNKFTRKGSSQDDDDPKGGSTLPKEVDIDWSKDSNGKSLEKPEKSS